MTMPSVISSFSKLNGQAGAASGCVHPFDKVVLAKLPGADIHAQAEPFGLHQAFGTSAGKGGRLRREPGADLEDQTRCLPGP